MDTKPLSSNVLIQGKYVTTIDETKAYLAQFGLRNLHDTEIVRIALKNLKLTPDLANEMRDLIDSEDRRRKPRSATQETPEEHKTAPPPPDETTNILD